MSDAGGPPPYEPPPSPGPAMPPPPYQGSAPYAAPAGVVPDRVGWVSKGARRD